MTSGRHVVEQIGRDVEQVLRDHSGRNLVAKNVAQQFEQGEDDDQHQKTGEDHREVYEEVAKYVVVEQSGETGAEDAAAGGGALEGVFAATAGGDGLRAGGVPLPEAAQRRQFKGSFLGAREQEYGECEKYKVGEPCSEPGRDFPLAGQRNSDQRDYVVDEDQQDGEHESAGLAALLGRQAERDSHQREHQAGGGQREALMKGDEIPAGGNGIDAMGLLPERARIHHVGGERFVGLVLGRGKVERECRSARR